MKKWIFALCTLLLGLLFDVGIAVSSPSNEVGKEYERTCRFDNQDVQTIDIAPPHFFCRLTTGRTLTVNYSTPSITS